MPVGDRQIAEPMHLAAAKRRWRKNMSKFSVYEYRKQPGFDMNTFKGSNQAIPMKTLVIHCLDPRAAEIPQAVAKYLGDEVYPGEVITDENGVRVGSTRTLFVATNAGGRAAFALECVAAMDYIFNVRNVVVVHHSFCGTTTLTPELIVEKFHEHYHAGLLRYLIMIASQSWTSRSRSTTTSGCSARAQPFQSTSSCMAFSTKSVQAS
jgi:hypothetical protein